MGELTLSVTRVRQRKLVTTKLQENIRINNKITNIYRQIYIFSQFNGQHNSNFHLLCFFPFN